MLKCLIDILFAPETNDQTDVTRRAVNVVKKYRKRGPLSYCSYSGRIMIAGKFSKSFDQLAMEMGSDNEAFDFLSECVFGVSVGQDGLYAIRRLGE
ncbi:MAG: hypothetical protein KAI86_10235 [Desulfobacterales bacterium]|nr:hypothetical protein [Desulfobacterales bacterium]